MLAETQLVVGSSVIVGMLFGALLMQLAREAPVTSFRDILESARGTTAAIGMFLLFTVGWAGYVASPAAVVFSQQMLPVAWALVALGIVRYGLASDLIVYRGQQLLADITGDSADDETSVEAAD